MARSMRSDTSTGTTNAISPTISSIPKPTTRAAPAARGTPRFSNAATAGAQMNVKTATNSRLMSTPRTA